MKKLMTLALALALTATVLSGCAGQGGSGAAAKTPEELKELYATAITENGGEMVEYNEVISELKEGDMSAMILETLGLTQDDMTAFGVSASMMNVQAYGIAAVMPAEGKEETVKEGLQGFIDRQKQSFEMYLPDQYEVAGAAKLETLDDGTILMVMTEGQDEVFEAIKSAIEKG